VCVGGEGGGGGGGGGGHRYPCCVGEEGPCTSRSLFVVVCNYAWTTCTVKVRIQNTHDCNLSNYWPIKFLERSTVKTRRWSTNSI